MVNWLIPVQYTEIYMYATFRELLFLTQQRHEVNHILAKDLNLAPDVAVTLYVTVLNCTSYCNMQLSTTVISHVTIY